MKIALPAYEDLNELKIFMNNFSKNIFLECKFVTEIEDNIDILILNKPILFSVSNWIDKIKSDGYIILNSDADILNSRVYLNERKLITAGLDLKSTITTSSTANSDIIQVCIQREFLNINNKIVCEQEFSFDVFNSDINNLLVFISLLVVLDEIKSISLYV